MAVGGKKPPPHAEVPTDDDEMAVTMTMTSREVKTDKDRKGGGGGDTPSESPEAPEIGTFLRDDDENIDDDNDDEESDPDYRCGWFHISCPCLKPFRSPKWALALLCLSSVMQGFIVNGLLNVVISTIEKVSDLARKGKSLRGAMTHTAFNPFQPLAELAFLHLCSVSELLYL